MASIRYVCVGLLCFVSHIAALMVVNSEPQKEVLEGFNVTISCVIEDIENPFGLTFYWTVPAVIGRTLQASDGIQSGRYLVSSDLPAQPRGDTSTVTGRSTLTVLGANATVDEGSYTCQLLNSATTPRAIATSETFLSVIKFDQITNSACWVEPSNVVIEGTKATFNCATRNQGDLSQLDLVLGTTSLSGEKTRQDDGTTTISQTLTIPVDLDQVDISCTDFRTNNVLCTTSVTLLYSPQVTIVPLGDIVYETDARFFCNASARPMEGFTYRWWYADVQIVQTSHHRFNRVLLENDNQTLVLPDLSASFDAGINLTCEVTNAIGTGRNAPYTIQGRQPRSVASTVGPILLACIFLIIIVVLVIFFFWRRSQRRVVRSISTKRKRATRSNQNGADLPTLNANYPNQGSFVAVSPMDLEAIGYGPDITSTKTSQVEPNDRDSGVGDDGIRPIPRRGSISSSMQGKVNYAYDQDSQSHSDMNLESADAPVDPYEDKLKSYSYEVNPNFNSYRKSQTFDVVTIPNDDDDYGDDSDTEIKTIPSDSGESDYESIKKPSSSGHIQSTNL